MQSRGHLISRSAGLFFLLTLCSFVAAQSFAQYPISTVETSVQGQMIGTIPDQTYVAGGVISNVPLSLSGFQTTCTFKTAAANITSGSYQKYEGPGTRILQGIKPDIVVIQEFNVSSNSTANLRAWVDSTFGAEFQYFRESSGSIPNGVISRWPILQSGSWDDGDSSVSDRGFAWAQIDIPGPRNLWAVSVHLKASSGSDNVTRRKIQAQTLVGLIQRYVPSNDYVLIGGDCNTYSSSTSSEPCLATLGTIVDVTDKPVDERGDPDTSAGRDHPYDRVMAEPELDALEVPVVFGGLSFSNGLVFDSRVFSNLPLVDPVQSSDSAASGMQHMAVVRSFRVDAPELPSVQVQSSNPNLLPADRIQVQGSGLNRSLSITPVAGQTGTSTVTVSVSDGIATDTQSFTFTLTSSGSGAGSFSVWSSNAPVTGPLAAKYAVGGAASSSAVSEAPVLSISGGRLSLSAIVRTNDSNLTVVGEGSGGLSLWSANGVTDTASADTAGVPSGFQRRIYSVELTNNPSKQFLRLKAVLTGQ